MRRRFAFFLGSLVIVAAAGASPRPVDPPRRTRAAARAEVPLSRLHGLPVVPVSVDGSGPYRFIVDWGANVLSVSPKLARELRLPATGRDERGNASVSIRKLEVGGDAFEGMTALVDPFFENVAADGVLGLNVYRSLIATIDYPAARFRLERGELPAADGKTTLDYRSEGPEEFLVSVEIAGRQVSAVLDTGASRGLLLPASAEKDFTYREPLAESAAVATGPQAGTYHPREGRLQGTLRLGEFEFPDPPVALNESPSFLIGAAVLDQFEVSLDQKNRRVRLRRAGASPVVAATVSDIVAHSASGGAADAALTDTVLGRRVRAYFDAFNSGDDARMTAFFEQNVSREMLRKRSPAERLRTFHEMRDVNKHFRVDRVKEGADGSITVFAENAGGQWRQFTFLPEDDSDRHFGGFRVEDSEPPGPGKKADEPPPSPKASDAEAAAATGALLSSLAEQGKFSGTVLLARHGKPFFSKAYGLANREFGAPCTPETKFNLGSMNKFLTTIAIGQLAAAGKLSLDDTIRKWLPDYANAYADRVTIAQLVTHRSGMGDMFTPRFAKIPPLEIRSLEDYLPAFEKDPLQFEPGERQQYSNAGFIVLGLIVQKASGENYFDYVKRHVLAPADMQSTASYEVDEIVPGRAEGYTLDGPPGPDGKPMPRRAVFTHPGRGSSAGGGYSTAADLLKLDRALRDGKLLSAEWSAWAVSHDAGKAPAPGAVLSGGFGFAGGSPGTNAVMLMNFDSGTTVVVLSNLDPPSAETVAQKIRGWLPK
jgi:D-alanyl-D-alanine carboxypeptidase